MIDEPDHAQHHHRTGHRWADFTLAGAALLVSVVSLTVAVLHGRTMEQMADANARLVQANSWPFVMFDMSVSPRELTFGLKNTGVGPAKVHWIEVYLAGRPVASARELLRGAARKSSSAKGRTVSAGFDASVVDDTVLRAGDSATVFDLRAGPTDPGLFQAMHDDIQQISIRACYCSVFDECFVGDGRSLDPQPVRACPKAQTPYDASL